jgi:hypothetical protein
MISAHDEKGEGEEGEKGGPFHKMSAWFKKKTEENFRAEEAARLRREQRIHQGTQEGMFNRDL